MEQRSCLRRSQIFMNGAHPGLLAVGKSVGNLRAGADVEKPVVVTLQEAYHGTTRLLERRLPTGQKRTVELNIPPGVETGTRIRFAGRGHRGQTGGSPGDLYLLIEVRPCSRFQRKDANLFHQLFVPQSVINRGGEVEVVTVDQKRLGLTIPPGTKDGQRFRLAGQGMPQLNAPDQRGDLYVTVTAKRPGERDKIQAGDATFSTQDDVMAVLFFTLLFLAGIGAGLLLYWLFIV